MWKCPVCDQENNVATVCPACGYDRTCDYERYPTAFAVTTAKPTATLRRQWQAKQGSAVNGGDRQAAQGCQGYVDGRWLEKATGQVTLSPKEAARGCTKSASLKCGDKYVHLTLSIPAGVVYGKKLLYPQINADDGATYDATAGVKIEESSWYVYLSYISFIITALPALIALIVCLFKGFSFSSGLAWIIVFAATFIASIVTSIISITRDNLCKEKYGPKTPEEKQRCEMSGQTDVPQQLFQQYQQEPDQAKRMEYLKKAAQMGYTPAQAELGDCYAQGRGVERDYAKASEWYRRAAGQPPQQPESPQQATKPQQTESPQQLFQQYQQEPDQAKRMEYLKRSAEMGYAEAQATMARCYANGRDVAKDTTEASHWFQRLAQQNGPEAWYWLGRCYSGGWGVEKRMDLAIQWYRKAAEQGYAPAQCQLGKCYYFGWGVEEDKPKAVQWYRKAADQGHANAQWWLGYCYAEGGGVKQDYAQAAHWYQKAAEQGYKDAQLTLAMFYEKGQGVPKDLSLAREWREKAKNN